ncbi:MAG: NAD(P)-binding protein [Bacteriovoracaceae bacterium]|jgi:all-trans-retinol 13,14-reductase|nr:NAD(P)-binding protein [Bacteriovoracaceae bacterium]
MKKKSVIIVGSGLGGLFSGAILSENGFQVTIIENHYNVGGFASCFKRAKSRHEVGIHCLDGFVKDTVKFREFEKLGIFENVEFVRAPDFYKIKTSNGMISIPDNIEETESTLCEHYPLEKESIKKYCNILNNIQSEIEKSSSFENDPYQALKIPILTKYKNYSLGKYLEKNFQSNELKSILMANICFYHDNPKELNFLIFMYGNSFYFKNGCYFIKGSSQTLGDYLKSLIEKNNGKFLLGTRVVGLEYKESEIQSIQIQKRTNTETSKLSADCYIFNNSPYTVSDWIKNESLLEIKNKQRQEPSISMSTIFLEFDQAPKTFGLSGYMSYFMLSEIESKIKDINAFCFIDYSEIDSGLTGDNKYIAAILFKDDYINWFHKSKEEYLRIKEHTIEFVINFLDKQFPGIKKSCTLAEMATPLTIERYTLNTHGAIYGFSFKNRMFSAENFLKNNISNMYFASAWSRGAGFSFASLSGIETAREIIGEYENEFF